MKPTTNPTPRTRPSGAGQTAVPGSATVSGMTTPAATDTGRDMRALFRLLLVLIGAVATVTFALSYYGIRDYAERVMGLPRWMSWLAPVAVDVFSLVGLVSAIALAAATLRARTYAWFVFVVAATASVGANIAHASERHLSHAGVVGAAVVPLFFLLSSHLAVVVRRHVVSQRPTAPASDMSQVGATGAAAARVASAGPIGGADVAPDVATHVASGAGPVSLVRPYVATGHVAGAVAPAAPAVSQPATPRATATRRTPARPMSRTGDTDSVKVARRRVAKGDTCATVAADLGVSKKTVERWTADLRESRTAATPNVASGDTKPANGHRPDIDLAGVTS